MFHGIVSTVAFRASVWFSFGFLPVKTSKLTTMLVSTATAVLWLILDGNLVQIGAACVWGAPMRLCIVCEGITASWRKWDAPTTHIYLKIRQTRWKLTLCSLSRRRIWWKHDFRMVLGSNSAFIILDGCSQKGHCLILRVSPFVTDSRK